MNRHRPQSRPAFTLIEVILVVIVVAISLSLAAPSLTGWGQGAKLDDAAKQFLSAARWARSEAIAKAVPHRIEVSAAGDGYTVLSDIDGSGNFAAVPGEFGRGTAMPTGFTIRVLTGGQSAGNILFQPNARTTPAVVRVTSPRGDAVDVACNYPADLFRVVTTDGEGR